MLNQLVEYGKRIRNDEDSDALKKEYYSIILIIRPDGSFSDWHLVDKNETIAEAIEIKQGKARLLLDKAEEVLGLDIKDVKKHRLFLDKLEEYANVTALKPAILFYCDNRTKGLEAAQIAFPTCVSEKERKGNIAFRVLDDEHLLHAKPEVLQAVKDKYISRLKAANGSQLCSVCGEKTYPVLDEPHGKIQKVPAGHIAGSTLVSYDKNAFESYGLKGNLNASICTSCAKNYVNGLNHLLSDGRPEKFTDKKGKEKDVFIYNHRKKLSSDTAFLFWTRSGKDIEEIGYVDKPSENAKNIKELLAKRKYKKPDEGAFSKALHSPATGKPTNMPDPDHFYALVLSGASARIAIRSWIELSSEEIQNNIANWFEDSSIEVAENAELRVHYHPINTLAISCARHRKDDNGYYMVDYDDKFIGVAAEQLWHAALTGKKLALTILERAVRRIRLEGGNISPARAAVIKLCLKRGGQMDTESISKISGRMFYLFESIQYAAQGEVNSSIADRFYTSASTTPAIGFGAVVKLNKHHLEKIRKEKPGLAKMFEDKLGMLCVKMGDNGWPDTFSLEEQGQFAIGYYQQREETKAEIQERKAKKELEDKNEQSS